jgi:hypothetical protein
VRPPTIPSSSLTSPIDAHRSSASARRPAISVCVRDRGRGVLDHAGYCSACRRVPIRFHLFGRVSRHAQNAPCCELERHGPSGRRSDQAANLRRSGGSDRCRALCCPHHHMGGDRRAGERQPAALSGAGPRCGSWHHARYRHAVRKSARRPREVARPPVIARLVASNLRRRASSAFGSLHRAPN